MDQKLKFEELYRQSKNEFKENILSMWTGGFPDSNGYENDLAKAIEVFFAPETTVPVVQSMFPWEPMLEPDAMKKANTLVNWKQDYFPFKHQFDCWDKLLNKRKSICVTTGTGSGKTECFMLPIIKDIADKVIKEGNRGIRAIFLYPLNALAEDQKKRLDEFLENIDPENRIKFAIYNGNTPESGDIDSNLEETLINEDGTQGTTDSGTTYRHELTSRHAIRENLPEILVTNPTMLEYIMLRSKDTKLLSDTLQWFVIDETHTFKGAAAAELAMLIRRVILACGYTDSSKIQFVTSSATTGTNEDDEIKKFIADLSWKSPDDIEIVKGERVLGKLEYSETIESVDVRRQKEIAELLRKKDFIYLNELLDKDKSTEENLATLDLLCEKVGIKAKVHFFFQAPSLGLSTTLKDVENGKFKLLNAHKSDDENYPLLELVRCKKCGNILARAIVTEVSDDCYKYRRNFRKNIDSFEIVTDIDDEDDQEQTDDTNSSNLNIAPSKQWIFAPSMQGNGDCCAVENAKIKVGAEGETGMTLRSSSGRSCPCCGRTIILNSNTHTNELHDDDSVTTYLMPLSVGAMFVSRTLSRKLLEQMTPSINHENPHNGQQFISFVDNRQAASKLTLDQSKDVEEQWIQSRAFSILSNLGLTSVESSELDGLYKLGKNSTIEQRKRRNELENKDVEYILWNDLHKALLDSPRDKEVKLLVEQFFTDKEQKNNVYNRFRYIMTLMYEQFGSRKPRKDSLETLGLVRTWYPVLENLDWDEIASSNVLAGFNEKYCNNSIQPEDWKDLVRMIVDYNMRTEGNVFYRNTDPNCDGVWNNISITQFRRYATVSDRRKPFVELTYKTRIGSLLRAVAGLYNHGQSLTEDQQKEIDSVLHSLSQILKENNILENQTWFIGKDKQDKYETEDSYRMNLEKMAFKLYDKFYYCPVTNRILPYTFMGYSPYMDSGKNPIKAEPIENWDKYDFRCNTEEEVKQWCRMNRQEYGNLTVKAAKLFLPDMPIFVSAEHTAQVDKDILIDHQEKFKKHDINILTCSTTMEMGVDLGDIELVVMNSIPPHPANYKQRAGRSGRREQNKSVAITFCGSDSVGKQTMADSMANLITREYSVPKVDLGSRQIVQRHVNAYLLRNYGCALLGDKVYNLFGENGFDIRPNNINVKETRKMAYLNGFRYPDFQLGDISKAAFKNIQNSLINPTDEMISAVANILVGTPYEGQATTFISCTIQQIESTFEELNQQFVDIANQWRMHLKNNNWEGETDPYIVMDSSYSRLLNHQYIGLLEEPLLNYLSTHQFTPNAAMPLNIIEFDIQEESDRYSKKRRPSYTLSRALSQYAPGRLVILNNVCYRSAGLDWKDRFSNESKGFRTIIQRETGEVEFASGIIDENSSNRKVYRLITPTMFKTNINAESTRISDGQIYAPTEAHLINVSVWNEKSDSKLILTRGSVEGTTPEILFLNKGKGNGYCVCLRCGKADVEEENGKFPLSFYLKDKEKKAQEHHYNISKELNKNNLKENWCDNELVRRNVVFGDTIQTDFCELKLFREEGIAINSLDAKNDKDKKILHTLGMLICDYMSKYLGIERDEIDYILTTLGTLCIYDLAKGGAGYSTQLLDNVILMKCLDVLYEKLSEKDQNGNYKFVADKMIDSFTVMNEQYIDLNATRTWLEEESGQRTIVPDRVKNLDAKSVYVEDFKFKLKSALKESKNITLYAEWSSVGGYQKFVERNGSTWYKECLPGHVGLCLFGYKEGYIPPYDNLKMSEARSKLFKSNSEHIVEGVYPIARIDDQLFVTDYLSSVQYDGEWGNASVYCIDAKINDIPRDEFNPVYPQSMDKFILPKGLDIKSSELLDILSKKSTNIIDSFAAAHRGEKMNICYCDEHLKSPLGMSITNQVIRSLINHCQPETVDVCFDMEEYVDEKSLPIIEMGKNIRTSQIRDEYLEKLCKNSSWGKTKIVSEDRKTLPHWRVLLVSSGDEMLCIYPNGGFANGWTFSRNNEKIYNASNLTFEDDIQIYLFEDIMFDVQVVKLK